VTKRSTRTIPVPELLALTVAYVLLLQGLFASAAASAQFATAFGTPSLTQTLCSGARAPGEAMPNHHAAAQSLCCAWSVSATLDPVVPPTALATVLPVLAPVGLPVPFGQVVQTAILFRVATAQGSRAPPTLVA
jgi:hypothetical protein